MRLPDLIYRLGQKYNYHRARNDFERNVADINRNYLRIKLRKDHFQIVGYDYEFSRDVHGFIVERFDLFMQLLRSGDSGIIADDEYLYYRSENLTLRITAAEEIFIIFEIYVRRCYDVLMENDFNVIDIGMNVGYASLFFAQNPKVHKIYGYEPFKTTFKAALANFEMNKKYAAKIIPENFGLGSGNHSLVASYNDLQKGKNKSSNSAFGLTETIRIQGAFEVIGSIIKENPAADFVVKMDCEGAEFEIFETFDNKPIPEQIAGFIIEWHDKDPQTIIDKLIGNHFKIHHTLHGDLGLITAFR